MVQPRRIDKASTPDTALNLSQVAFRMFALGVLLALLHCAIASAEELTLEESGGPFPVYIAVFVIDVDAVDSAEQNFTANVFYSLRWKDPRLAHSGGSPITRPLSQFWKRAPQIVNQQRLWNTFPEVVSIEPDGTVTYRQRVWGAFSQPLRLHDFPFDRQDFTLQFATGGFREGDLKVVPDPDFESGIAPQLSLADWEVTSFEAVPRRYQPFPGGRSAPGFHLTFHAERHSGFYVLKIILPLLLIVWMSWVVFWIDPREAGTQVSVAITTMLTLIAYRFAVGNDLPNVSYLTRMDYFILASTILVFATLMEVVVTATLAKSGRIDRALVIDRCARWIVPVGFTGVTLAAFL